MGPNGPNEPSWMYPTQIQPRSTEIQPFGANGADCAVHCIFGVMYMHFWYAMHRQLWWCLFGVITIVQCIFGALFLGIGCNIFLVLHLWCYALSAISRWLATAVAHLLYMYEKKCLQIKTKPYWYNKSFEKYIEGVSI